MTLLIWGAGAIGGTIGAYLARAGEDVLLVDRDAAHVEAMNARGLAIEGPVEEFVQPVRAATPDAVSRRFDRVVLAVKAQDTAAACEALAPRLAEGGFVLSAQNGLNERVIAERLGAARTMGAFVNFGADWLGPGRILYGNRGAVVVGELDGRVTDRARATHATLRLFEPDAVLTDNIFGYLWGKLAYGAMLFATALTHDSMTANFANPRLFPVWRELGREAMAVAAAEGVSPLGFNGFDPSAFAPGAPEAAARESVARLADFNSRTAKTHSGIWRDIAVRRRKTEAEPQLGAVLEAASRHGVPAPAMARLFDLIRDIEEGRREQSAETMEELLTVAAR